MSINGVSEFCNLYFYGQKQLSEKTKRKLQLLGIEPSAVQTEAQAQAIIDALEQTQQVQPTTNQSGSRNTLSSEAEVFTKAKALAQHIGISISQTDSMENIIDKISSKIEGMEKIANGNNENEHEVFKYRNDLESIRSEYETIKDNKKALMASMTMTGYLNMHQLGLNH